MANVGELLRQEGDLLRLTLASDLKSYNTEFLFGFKSTQETVINRLSLLEMEITTKLTSAFKEFDELMHTAEIGKYFENESVNSTIRSQCGYNSHCIN